MQKVRCAPGKKSVALVILALCLLCGLLAAFLMLPKETAGNTGAPTLTVETPERVSRSGLQELVLDVTISSLGEAEYPAASASISFDPSRLEFLGVEEGNVFICDASNGAGQKLPEWSCSAVQSNNTGMINVIYLDLTGGDHAFTQKLLAEEDNVLLRLRFRLRGSVRVGDVCDLTVEDAVFAASDEAQSLSMVQETLQIRDGRIVIGE